MRDERHDRDASGDDQNQRKDYCYLFYNRVASCAPNVARTGKFRDCQCVNYKFVLPDGEAGGRADEALLERI